MNAGVQCVPLGCAHLNWYRRGGVDECASGQTSPSAGISQEGDRRQAGREHAGTDGREHSGWTPSDLLGLVQQAHQRQIEQIKLQHIKMSLKVSESIMSSGLQQCKNFTL